MLIAGSISGIQDYLFDVAREGGGQARRLRARSFFIQALVEVAALRSLQAAGWGADQLVFCSAGKFLAQGGEIAEPQASALLQTAQEVNAWLLEEAGGRLHFSLVSAGGGGTAKEEYEEAMRGLGLKKKQAWGGVAAAGGAWEPEKLVLAALEEPCELCHRRRAVTTQTDGENTRRVCRRCADDRELGRLLPQARWAVLSAQPTPDSFAVGGWFIRLTPHRPALSDGDFIISLDGRQHADGAGGADDGSRVLWRRLARHIPTSADGRIIEFVELAGRAHGDRLLGVLKMDADSVGRHIDRILQGASDLTPLGNFSREFDEFFAGHLNRLLSKQPWDVIYTVFSGGDDLLLVGPWDVLFDFAGEIQRKFHAQFGARRLTLSGGLVLIKPKRPIRFAAAQAEELLEAAKERAAPGAPAGRDQFAAFGQVWKWRDHRVIFDAAAKLIGWVEAGVAERGWLHTLLELALLRQNPAAPDRHLATARLAYHVSRNYQPKNAADPEKKAFREWAEALVRNFDAASQAEVIYLPAILRCALAATRTTREEEDR